MVMMVCRIFEYGRSTRVDTTGTALNLKSLDKLVEYRAAKITTAIRDLGNTNCSHALA